MKNTIANWYQLQRTLFNDVIANFITEHAMHNL
jgi:hypothetical protein